jgi:hypothetical protein
MDLNFVLALCTALVGATAYVATTAVFVKTTRTDMKNLREDFRELRNDFKGFKTSVEARLNRLENDVTEIKAICREWSHRDTP